ncbi:MAG: HflC protein [uncultured Thiotrichaceae bacterium]|uniref:Protein HflC n=1 Tax=uncultured Thiotrichaceae bacterium TaxID=298394 RepID=A0A6S6TEH1_9GAMM|nr:MAG: HflC protein [uncultured Thiotrichaceae bacterium]
MKVSQGLFIAIAVAIFIVFTSIYTVDEREKALKFRFKEIVQADIGPGLHFKWPTNLVDNIKKFPAQVLVLQVDKKRFLTGEKKYVLVDFFVEWKIKDVTRYYVATRGDYATANRRLESIMTAGLRGEFGKRTIQEAISGQRGEIMQTLQEKSNIAANELGVQVVDVRVSRIDFPDSVSESVYDRMRSERMRVAQDFRSRGEEEAEKIKAAADRQSTVIMANAYKEAETVRGEGDAKASAIYAQAYQQDSEFYSFYRSLNAYKNSLGQEGDVMVLEPNSEFFEFFKNKGK